MEQFTKIDHILGYGKARPREATDPAPPSMVGHVLFWLYV